MSSDFIYDHQPLPEVDPLKHIKKMMKIVMDLTILVKYLTDENNEAAELIETILRNNGFELTDTGFKECDTAPNLTFTREMVTQEEISEKE